LGKFRLPASLRLKIKLGSRANKLAKLLASTALMLYVTLVPMGVTEAGPPINSEQALDTATNGF
jgi:hypothetical protein